MRIAANLRHETLEPLFNEQSIGQTGPDYPVRVELEWLYGFAKALDEPDVFAPLPLKQTAKAEAPAPAAPPPPAGRMGSLLDITI